MWNRPTGRLQKIATSPLDGHGHPIAGGWMTLQITDRYLYWIQAAPDPHNYAGTGRGSALQQYDLQTGRTRTLYTGLVTAFTPYRDQIIMTAMPPGSGPVTYNKAHNMIVPPMALDQASGRQVALPPGFSTAGLAVDNLASNGTEIAWYAWDMAPDTPSGQSGGLYLFDGTHTTVIVESAVRGGGADDLFFVGPLLAWRQTPTAYVLDTRTLTQVRLIGSTAEPSWFQVDGGWMMVAVDNPGGSSPTRHSYRIYLLNLASLPGLPACPVHR